MCSQRRCRLLSLSYGARGGGHAGPSAAPQFFHSYRPGAQPPAPSMPPWPEEIVAAPWWIDGQRAPLRKTAPTLGEGNDYVLGQLLGWSPEDREELVASDMERRHGSK